MTAPNVYNTLVITTAVWLCARSAVLSAPLCLTGDFDSQLRHVLHEQTLSTQETADLISQVLGDVHRTLDQRWRDYELLVCGSTSTGLGTQSSDVDLVVRLPNFNSSAGLYVLQETEKLLEKEPLVYSQLSYRHMSVYYTSFLFFHIPSQRMVQLEFDTGDRAVANSKLMRYYFALDKRFLALGGFLKYWFRLHGLTVNRNYTLTNYGLYLLIIFYLQQKNMVPPGYMLQIGAQSDIDGDGWDVGFNELPYSSESTESLHQLLGGFFKYYSEFNFEQYIVSPFAGRPIPKNAFTDINNFPEEYTLNNHTKTKRLDVRNYWNRSTDICIQDVFLHYENTAMNVSNEIATKFKYLIKSVATMFEDLPSDSVLAGIFNVDQQSNCY